MPNFTSQRYGSQSFFPDTTVSAQLGGGSTFAVGGPANPQSEAIEQVDVSAQAQAIDENRATITLAALLGGKSGDADTGTVTATFLSATGAALGSVTIGPVTDADRGSQTTLVPRSRAAAVLVGTRSIRAVATATRTPASVYNDASFDNLSLMLDITPAAGGGALPSVTRETLSPTRFPAAPTGPSVHAARRRYGAKVRYTLDRAASVRFAVVKRRPGARAPDGRCVKRTRANRRRRKCARLVRLHGSFRLAGVAGANSFRFTGRLAGRTLKPARYRLTATPSAGGKTGKTASAAFRIIK
jgi:hypothetical protein